MQYRLIRKISGKGNGPDRFAESLRGLAVNNKGLLYAAGDRQVKVFDTTGNLQKRWPTARPPFCVAVDTDNAVYVGQPDQIEKFDPNGKQLWTMTDTQRFGLITEIALTDQNILIGDAANRCIHRYAKDRKFLNTIGKNNKREGFLIPNVHVDFCVDSDRIIHATNPGKHRVERYTLTGERLGHFGKFGGRDPEGFSGCCNPTNVTLTTAGQIVVTEKAPARVKLYDPGGKLLAVIDDKTFDPNCKNMDVVTDSKGQVYVADTVRLNVCVFACEKTDGVASAGGDRP